MGLPLAISIDNYLDAHRNDETVRELGKLAIAVAILDAERNSALNHGNLSQIAGIDRFTSNLKLDQSWYLPLMRLLTSGKSVEDVLSLFTSVAFISFNYDRCLEQFLINAVMAYFNVQPQVATQCMSQLRIVYPYGRVGALSWQDHPILADFGNPAAELCQIAQGIQTFTESTNKGVVSEVKELVANPETLVIMGYSFLAQNNELLSVNGSSVRRVFATTKGISDSDVPIIKQTICNIIDKKEAVSDYDAMNGQYAQIFIERAFCRDLMDNHRFRLSRDPEHLLTLGG